MPGKDQHNEAAMEAWQRINEHTSQHPSMGNMGAQIADLANPGPVAEGGNPPEVRLTAEFDLDKANRYQSKMIIQWQTEWLKSRGWVATQAEIRAATQEAIRVGHIPVNNF